MSMSLILAESAEHGPDVNPYVVGVVVLALFLLLMFGLLSFGKGRDHT